MEKIVLPSTLQHIESEAFEACWKLKDIAFPSSLRTIGSDAFSGTSIETICLNEGLKEIGGSAFSLCKSLKYVILPKTVEKIDESKYDNYRKYGIRNPVFTRNMDENLKSDTNGFVIYAYPGTYGYKHTKEFGYSVKDASKFLKTKRRTQKCQN